jgi:hypothetical protein
VGSRHLAQEAPVVIGWLSPQTNIAHQIDFVSTSVKGAIGTHTCSAFKTQSYRRITDYTTVGSTCNSHTWRYFSVIDLDIP